VTNYTEGLTPEQRDAVLWLLTDRAKAESIVPRQRPGVRGMSYQDAINANFRQCLAMCDEHYSPDAVTARMREREAGRYVPCPWCENRRLRDIIRETSPCSDADIDKWVAARATDAPDWCGEYPGCGCFTGCREREIERRAADRESAP
jgi:hypothetical protein